MDKAKIQQVMDELPPEVDVDAFMERLYLLQKIEIAEKQLAAGQGIPHTEVKKRLEQWLK